jgi:hypothetical protein
VSLVKEATGGGEQKTVSNLTFSPNFKPDLDVPAQDGHLQTIMYPGGADNHKRGYCADGALQIMKKGDDDGLPDWPQPQGIFKKGGHYYPIEFLKTLREVYKTLVVDRASGVDVPIEYEAMKMLGKRTTIDQDDIILFRLFDLTIPPSNT